MHITPVPNRDDAGRINDCMDTGDNYKGLIVEKRTSAIDVPTLIARYRDTTRFLEACRQCPLYGRQWCCPPFKPSALQEIKHYQTAILTGITATPREQPQTLGSLETLMQPLVDDFNTNLIVQERTTGGMALVFTGRCRHCGDTPCARLDGMPCRHPEAVRPSMESYGFDLVAIARDIFGIEMEWGSNGMAPSAVTLIGAVLHRANR